MSIIITKADGTTEAFSSSKLVNSLRRAGAEQGVADEIAEEVGAQLYPGIATQEIYRRAFAALRKYRAGTAARYSLKRALLDFGPSGFPFETYLGELFRLEGYGAKVSQIIQGACVEHEVDVVLTKNGVTTYVEAKFHNAAGYKTDLKTTLYVKARLEDIAAAHHAKEGDGQMQGLIVTNTKFTSKAVQYASCAGVELLGWEHPAEKTLSDRIEAAQLYPITALTTLGRREKMALLGQRIVLCKALSEDTRALSVAGVTGKKADQVLEEVGALCTPAARVQ